MAKLDHERPKYNIDDSYVDSERLDLENNDIVKVTEHEKPKPKPAPRNHLALTELEFKTLLDRPVASKNNSKLKEQNRRKRPKRKRKVKK